MRTIEIVVKLKWICHHNAIIVFRDSLNPLFSSLPPLPFIHIIVPELNSTAFLQRFKKEREKIVRMKTFTAITKGENNFQQVKSFFKHVFILFLQWNSSACNILIFFLTAFVEPFLNPLNIWIFVECIFKLNSSNFFFIFIF